MQTFVLALGDSDQPVSGIGRDYQNLGDYETKREAIDDAKVRLGNTAVLKMAVLTEEEMKKETAELYEVLFVGAVSYMSMAGLKHIFVEETMMNGLLPEYIKSSDGKRIVGSFSTVKDFLKFDQTELNERIEKVSMRQFEIREDVAPRVSENFKRIKESKIKQDSKLKEFEEKLRKAMKEKKGRGKKDA